MFRNKLLITAGIIILILLGNYFSYWLIPEKLVKRVYLEALRSPQAFPTKMQKYLLEPDQCITLSKDINVTEDLKQKVFILPADLNTNEVKYIHRQKLSENLMVYYVSAMPRYEQKIKVDARVLLIKTKYKWLVKSISIDLVSTLEHRPSFLSY